MRKVIVLYCNNLPIKVWHGATTCSILSFEIRKTIDRKLVYIYRFKQNVLLYSNIYKINIQKNNYCTYL